MICVKLARLIHSPDHVDSLVDIAGYARCACMIIDRAKEREPMTVTEVELRLKDLVRRDVEEIIRDGKTES